MQPSDPKTDLPSAGFVDFILAVVRRRIFLAFLLLALAALILQFSVPGFSLPAVLYLGLVFLGFVWAGFQAHRALALAYRQAMTPAPFERNRRSGLTISFAPGSEYAYSVSDPYDGRDVDITRMQSAQGVTCRFDGRGRFFLNDQVYYRMGRGGLVINFHLLNAGDAPLEVTSIRVYDDLDLSHLRIYFDGVFQHGRKLRLPLHLAKGEVVTLQARHRISLAMGSTDGLFAADFRVLPRFISHAVAVEAVDAKGERQTFTGEIKTSTESLKEVYVRQWREYEQEEYLVLAGYSLKGDG